MNIEPNSEENRRTDDFLPEISTFMVESGTGKTTRPLRLIDITVYDLVDEVPTAEHQWQNEPSRGKMFYVYLSLVVLGLFVIVGGILAAYILFLTPSATVTIVPTTKQGQGTSTLVLNTGTAPNGQIQARQLPTITMSQALSVATTGRTDLPAQSGHGIITFYNAATYPQTIAGGTLLTGSDGVQVVTDRAVTVPSASFPEFGQTSVSAHAIQTGPMGNIKANDIYGSCCLMDMKAVSSAFVGGQDAQIYTSVAKSDIDKAVTKLSTTLDTAIEAAFNSQLGNNETLVAPISCQPTTTTDHQAGDRASLVQVALSQTCTGLAYNTQSLQQSLQHLMQQSEKHPHYRLSASVKTTIQSVAQGTTSGTYTLTVKFVATWVYQFSRTELATIASHLAGMDTKQATSYLLHTSGVQQVSFSATNGTLPGDTGKIHFLLVEG